MVSERSVMTCNKTSRQARRKRSCGLADRHFLSRATSSAPEPGARWHLAGGGAPGHDLGSPVLLAAPNRCDRRQDGVTGDGEPRLCGWALRPTDKRAGSGLRQGLLHCGLGAVP